MRGATKRAQTRRTVGAVEATVVAERNAQRAAFVDAAQTLTKFVDEHRETLVDVGLVLS